MPPTPPPFSAPQPLIPPLVVAHVTRGRGSDPDASHPPSLHFTTKCSEFHSFTQMPAFSPQTKKGPRRRGWLLICAAALLVAGLHTWSSARARWRVLSSVVAVEEQSWPDDDAPAARPWTHVLRSLDVDGVHPAGDLVADEFEVDVVADELEHQQVFIDAQQVADGLVRPEEDEQAATANLGQQAGKEVAPDTSDDPRWKGKDAVWAAVPVHLPDWAKQCKQPPCSPIFRRLGHVTIHKSADPMPGQFRADAWLQRNLFYRKTGGLFVELGAADELDGSVTLGLEATAGWRGVLVEGDSTHYAKLVDRRPDAIAVQAAVCDDFRTVHWHGDGLVRGAWELMAEPLRQQFPADEQLEDQPEVSCIPLPFILQKLGLHELDLLALDASGGELQVLKVVDWKRLKVRVILVSTGGHDQTSQDELAGLLQAAGYQAVGKGASGEGNSMSKHNTVWVHETAWPHLRHSPDVAKAEM